MGIRAFEQSEGYSKKWTTYDEAYEEKREKAGSNREKLAKIEQVKSFWNKFDFHINQWG